MNIRPRSQVFFHNGGRLNSTRPFKIKFNPDRKLDCLAHRSLIASYARI
jgi:hypothetical protein